MLNEKRVLPKGEQANTRSGRAGYWACCGVNNKIKKSAGVLFFFVLICEKERKKIAGVGLAIFFVVNTRCVC